MNLYLDGRTGKERRDYGLEFPPAGECRMTAERRNPRMAADKMADYNRVLSEGYWGASEDDTTTE
ncbi:MAG: hypothetical protein H6R17_1482 [Proteobacteria bacterium]|nr:hypothetical protein [Pseudomonadota bacterium]